MQLHVAPLRLMVMGTILLVVGAVLPFLMVIQVLPNGLALSFLAYASSLAGLFIGMIGLASYSGRRRAEVDEDPWLPGQDRS